LSSTGVLKKNSVIKEEPKRGKKRGEQKREKNEENSHGKKRGRGVLTKEIKNCPRGKTRSKF